MISLEYRDTDAWEFCLNMLVNQHVSNCEYYNLGVLDRYCSEKQLSSTSAEVTLSNLRRGKLEQRFMGRRNEMSRTFAIGAD